MKMPSKQGCLHYTGKGEWNDCERQMEGGKWRVVVLGKVWGGAGGWPDGHENEWKTRTDCYWASPGRDRDLGLREAPKKQFWCPQL